MGNHTMNEARARRAALAQMPGARWAAWGALQLAIASLPCAQLAAAQSTEATLPPAAPPPATEEPARAQAAPVTDEAAEALSARVDALDTLAKGALPAMPLDALLSVSLDDDSSMIERDQQARLEQRRLVIALRQSERAQDKSEAELQSLRDQILALELERKVLALPMEVRERLVQESAEPSAPPPPVPPAPKPEPAKPELQGIAPQAEARRGDTQPTHATAQPAAPARHERPWFSGWMPFAAVWAITFVAARAVRAVARPSRSGIPDERREQSGRWAQLGIYIAGGIVALLVSFELRPDVRVLIVGAISLLAVLACREVAASLLGGWLLFFQQPFRVGYQVEIAGVEGRVTEMGLLCVRLLGPLNRSIQIPNREFLTKHVSASPPSGIVTQVQVDFYIHPQDDIAQAKHIINEVVQSTRDADAAKGRGGIVVSQVPLNGMVMVRLRTKVYVLGTHPEQEVASELTERVLARLHPGRSANEPALSR